MAIEILTRSTIRAQCDICGKQLQLKHEKTTLGTFADRTPHGPMLHPHFASVTTRYDIVTECGWHVRLVDGKLLCETCCRKHEKLLKDAEDEYNRVKAHAIELITPM